ncbi:hypothetical protein GA0115255_108424, partial [Streptomyces sp. Ncost-T6T-2b]
MGYSPGAVAASTSSTQCASSRSRGTSSVPCSHPANEVRQAADEGVRGQTAVDVVPRTGELAADEVGECRHEQMAAGPERRVGEGLQEQQAALVRCVQDQGDEGGDGGPGPDLALRA